MSPARPIPARTRTARWQGLPALAALFGSEPQPRLALATCLAVALGFALRWVGLETHSLWMDEVMTVWIAQSESVVDTVRADRHPPLSFWLFRAWTDVFGSTDAALRALPAIVSCTTLALVAIGTRSAMPPAEAALCTLLLAVSPFSAWYGQEVRGYCLVEFGSALHALGALRVVRGGRGWGDTAAMVAGPMIALGSHYSGYLVGATAVGLAATLWRRDRGGALRIVAATALGFCAWLPWLATSLPTQIATGWGFADPPSLVECLEAPVRLVLLHPGEVVAWLAWVPYACIVGVGIAMVAFAVRLYRSRFALSDLAVAAVFAAPLLYAVASAFVLVAMCKPRYLMPAELGMLAVVACGLVSLPARVRAVVIAVLTAGLLAITASHKASNLKDDFRFAYGRVVETWQPGDSVCSLIGTFPGFAEAPHLHYLRAHPAVLARAVTERELLAGRAPAGRLHLVFREAPYTWPLMQQVEQTWSRVLEDPMRQHVQHLILEPR